MVQLPDADITFIQQALWRKLRVGTRLAWWQPQGTACITTHSTPLPVPTGGIPPSNSVYGACRVDDGTIDDVEDILSWMPALSLSSPLGLVMWSTVHANWRMRCSHKFNPRPSPPHRNHFVRLWINTLEPWMDHSTPTLPHAEVKMLLHGLDQLDGPDGLLDHPRASQPGSPPPHARPTLHYPVRNRSRK